MSRTLIVVDMQPDFVTGPLGTQEAQAIVPGIQEKIRNTILTGGDVVFTRDTHDEDYLGTQEGRKLPVKHCIRGTDGWQAMLMPKKEDLTPGSDHRLTVIDKPCFGVDWVQAIRLDDDLCAIMSAQEIELVGVCTDICVVSNALAIRSLYPETRVIVDAACCAGTTPENHIAALKVMKSCQIDVINMPEEETRDGN